MGQGNVQIATALMFVSIVMVKLCRSIPLIIWKEFKRVSIVEALEYARNAISPSAKVGWVSLQQVLVMDINRGME